MNEISDFEVIALAMNDTPKGERFHIAFFGRRNAGKSSIVNLFTSQNISIVSDIKGTTTDPVYKAMELLPLGPVMIIDTPGIDDDGELGKMRVEKTKQVFNKTELAVIVADATQRLKKEENELIETAKAKNIPYLVVWNKSDLLNEIPSNKENAVWVSAKTGYGIENLKKKCADIANTQENSRRIVGDILSCDDVVVLVVPIDKSAPKGRLILPQQQTIRDILDSGCNAIVCRDTELSSTLSKLSVSPKLIITDSQVFKKVSKIIPENIPLTSFSILMARYKGNLPQVVAGVKIVNKLKNGDHILIAEGCTHHRQCEDIGTVKIPHWIHEFTGADVEISTVSGTEFPNDLSGYKLIVHCGGCTLNKREMHYRLQLCQQMGIPITNYGILIAYINGILPRVLAPFPDISKILSSDII